MPKHFAYDFDLTNHRRGIFFASNASVRPNASVQWLIALPACEWLDWIAHFRPREGPQNAPELWPAAPTYLFPEFRFLHYKYYFCDDTSQWRHYYSTACHKLFFRGWENAVIYGRIGSLWPATYGRRYCRRFRFRKGSSLIQHFGRYYCNETLRRDSILMIDEFVREFDEFDREYVESVQNYADLCVLIEKGCKCSVQQ